MASMRQLIESFKKVNSLLKENEDNLKPVDVEFIDKTEIEEELNIVFDPDVYEVDTDPLSGEVFPIKISTLIKALQDLKSKGANWVEIETHIDHQSYIVSGFKIEPPLKKKIDKVLDV